MEDIYTAGILLGVALIILGKIYSIVLSFQKHLLLGIADLLAPAIVYHAFFNFRKAKFAVAMTVFGILLVSVFATLKDTL